MDDRHVRSARVLDPSYVSGIDARSLDELREMHAECTEFETEVSYVRRLAQARIDILEAEVERRSTGGSLTDLVDALPRILADSGPRGNPATSRLPLHFTPEQEGEWEPDLARFDSVLARLPSLDEAQLDAALEGLRQLERSVSDERRQLHGVIDQIDVQLAAAHR
jgi:hypothetical protein